ncbi:MAG: hypothetical protein KKD69_04365, partial [Euryarchaeota archaeon]|nr:hypothetical protein [Euryarchaeota archaeon]
EEIQTDGINRIDRIDTYPVHPVNPVKINERESFILISKCVYSFLYVKKTLTPAWTSHRTSP